MKTELNLIKNASTIALMLFPFFAWAKNITDIINDFKNILNFIIPLFMILATVIFLWGVITYITAGGEEEKIKSGRTYMLWGIIALFVMVAVWGLVNVLLSTFVNEAPISEGVHI